MGLVERASWSPAADAERLHEIIDLAGGDTMHVGLHHHREQGAVDPSAPLQQRREERSLAQLRDLELDIARRCRQQTSPVPVALRCASLGALMGAAPMNAVASASISCWRTHSRLVRMGSVISPALSAASSSDRS